VILYTIKGNPTFKGTIYLMKSLKDVSTSNT